MELSSWFYRSELLAIYDEKNSYPKICSSQFATSSICSLQFVVCNFIHMQFAVCLFSKWVHLTLNTTANKRFRKIVWVFWDWILLVDCITVSDSSRSWIVLVWYCVGALDVLNLINFGTLHPNLGTIADHALMSLSLKKNSRLTLYAPWGACWY